MFIKSFIFVAVICSAAVAGVPRCRTNELQCAGRCVSRREGCIASNGCQLKKQPQFTYQCQTANGDYGHCKDFVAVDSTVKVTRHSAEDTDNAVSVQFSCTKDHHFNISLDCVEEIKTLQNEFNVLSIPKIKNPFDTLNPANPKLDEMAPNFSRFQHQIIAKLNQMQEKIAECDIYINVLSAYLIQESPTETTKCELPQKPDNGRYTVATSHKWLPSGLLMKVVTGLEYKCDVGFALVGTSTPRCVSGSWRDEFPRCSAACKLEKKSKFNYQCPYNFEHDGLCGEYIPVGAIVRVSRRQHTYALNVTVSIVCLNEGTFNFSTSCVQDVDDLQQEFENPTMSKMAEYESKFLDYKPDETSSAGFQNLVEEFHTFEKYVHDKLRDMHEMADECDIYLDLILPE